MKKKLTLAVAGILVLAGLNFADAKWFNDLNPFYKAPTENTK